jgi:hypothetical protein
MSDTLTRDWNWVSLSPCEGVWDWGDSIFHLNQQYTALQFKKQLYLPLTYFTEDSSDNKSCDSDICDKPETSYLTSVSDKLKQFYIINHLEGTKGKYFPE